MGLAFSHLGKHGSITAIKVLIWLNCNPKFDYCWLKNPDFLYCIRRVFPYCTKLAMMASLYYLNLLSVNSHIHFDSKYYVKCKFSSTFIQLVTISNSIWSRTKMLALPTLCWYSKQEKRSQITSGGRVSLKFFDMLPKQRQYCFIRVINYIK